MKLLPILIKGSLLTLNIIYLTISFVYPQKFNHSLSLKMKSLPIIKNKIFFYPFKKYHCSSLQIKSLPFLKTYHCLSLHIKLLPFIKIKKAAAKHNYVACCMNQKTKREPFPAAALCPIACPSRSARPRKCFNLI